MDDTMIYLTDLNAAQIAESLDIKPFVGKQLFRWLHQKQEFAFANMTDISKTLREQLTERCVAAQLQQVAKSKANRCGTRKVLYKLKDDETVESVMLRDRERITLCLSTQVGCPVGCAFCATGQSGFVRNLSAGEIVEQALHLLKPEKMGERTPNLVFMGMGEPFLNYDALIQSIHLLMDKDGLNIGARKMTISTVGIVPGIERFARENWQVRLSISLHAANNELRSRLIPSNTTYPLEQLMKAVREYQQITQRQVTFEWVMLAGLNHSERDAKQLASLIQGIDASVNLIPFNGVADCEFGAPSAKQCAAFMDSLYNCNVNATLRKERGQEIDAACGQLRRRLSQ